jgi:hypothetical protein
VPIFRRPAEEIIGLKQEGVRLSEIALRLGIGRASVYRCSDRVMCVYEVKTYACIAAQYSDGSRHPFGFWMGVYHSSQPAAGTQPPLWLNA